MMSRRLRHVLMVLIFIYLFVNFCRILFSSNKMNKDPYYDIDFDPNNRTLIIRYKEFILREALYREKGTGCNRLKIDPFHKELIQFDKKYGQINCTLEEFDWVKCHLSTCKIQEQVYEYYKEINCGYSEIIFLNDSKTVNKKSKMEIINETTGEFVLTKRDHVMILCSGKNKKTSLKHKWSGFGAGIRENILQVSPLPGRENTPNILILAFDSLANSAFIRKMPKSYQVLKENLNAIVLDGYNIVGDGTVANMFPFFTGHHDLELPDARNDVKGTSFLDDFPFLFSELRKDGTAYFEDLPWMGTFQLRHNGFRVQPTDHYLRPFFLTERRTRSKRKIKPYCIDSDTPTFLFMLKQTEQVHSKGGKKFSFTFIGDITHDDINRITSADEDVAEFLMRVKDLSNTLIIVMGDHGPRYKEMRGNFYGKFDERHPFMAIVLPDKFVRERPEALDALRKNIEVLTTPFDMHTTMLDLVDLSHLRNPYAVPGSTLIRGLSLLDVIPKQRSCSEAGIEPHWCPCLKWKLVDPSEPKYLEVVNKFIEFVNDFTEEHRNLCELRKLKSVDYVQKQVYNEQFLKFQGGLVWNLYIGLFNKTTRVPIESFQIKVILSPGNATYEATLTYSVAKSIFYMDPRDVSRLDWYADQTKCINNTSMKKYCYCK